MGTKKRTKDLNKWQREKSQHNKNIEEAKMVYHLSPKVQDQPGQLGKTSTQQKNTRISQAWWHIPVVPATQEAKVERQIEPTRSRLQ